MIDAVDLIRALCMVARSNEERMGLIQRDSPTMAWFLEHIDDLAPELHRLRLVEYAPFTETPGEVVVTTGNGDVQTLVVTEFGRKQINVAEMS